MMRFLLTQAENGNKIQTNLNQTERYSEFRTRGIWRFHLFARKTRQTTISRLSGNTVPLKAGMQKNDQDIATDMQIQISESEIKSEYFLYLFSFNARRARRTLC